MDASIFLTAIGGVVIGLVALFFLEGYIIRSNPRPRHNYSPLFRHSEVTVRR